MRAIQAEGQHSQACCWGLRTRGPLEESHSHALPCASTERLELEKNRSRQELEDAEHLRFKGGALSVVSSGLRPSPSPGACRYLSGARVFP